MIDSKDLLAYINATPVVQSILYDLDLMPEQCISDKACAHMFNVAHHFRVATDSLRAENDALRTEHRTKYLKRAAEEANLASCITPSTHEAVESGNKCHSCSGTGKVWNGWIKDWVACNTCRGTGVQPRPMGWPPP